MLHQSSDTIVMVRPDHFGFNEQTAETNPYQHNASELHKEAEEIKRLALQEFDSMVQRLRENEIDVLILPSRTDVVTPDAVFPNNWFSHHESGTLVLYPMLTPNRRLERQEYALTELLTAHALPVKKVLDLTMDEEQGLILEATGSIILDRLNKVAFAMASPRTNEKEFDKWCHAMRYEGVYIKTPPKHFSEVYHTNLLLCIGTDFAVVCTEVLENVHERQRLLYSLKKLDREVIEITLEQVYSFCGNILEVRSQSGQRNIIMSETARTAFTAEQHEQLSQHGEIIAIAIPTIETVGGGGVRCMMAEVFKKQR